MIPGTVSKVSEEVVSLTATITVKSDMVHVTSTATTTVVATISPVMGGFSQFLLLANRSGGTITSTTSGNINSAFSLGNGLIMVLVYSKLLGKWIQGAQS